MLDSLDVAVRRLMLTSSDAQRFRAWAAERIPWRRASASGQPEPPRILGSLFQARDRARREREPLPPEEEAGTSPTAPARPSTPPPAKPPAAAPPPQPPTSQEDSLARLRQAKKRARGKED